MSKRIAGLSWVLFATMYLSFPHAASAADKPQGGKNGKPGPKEARPLKPGELNAENKERMKSLGPIGYWRRMAIQQELLAEQQMQDEARIRAEAERIAQAKKLEKRKAAAEAARAAKEKNREAAKNRVSSAGSSTPATPQKKPMEATEAKPAAADSDKPKANTPKVDVVKTASPPK